MTRDARRRSRGGYYSRAPGGIDIHANRRNRRRPSSDRLLHTPTFARRDNSNPTPPARARRLRNHARTTRPTTDTIYPTSCPRDEQRTCQPRSALNQAERPRDAPVLPRASRRDLGRRSEFERVICEPDSRSHALRSVRGYPAWIFGFRADAARARGAPASQQRSSRTA